MDLLYLDRQILVVNKPAGVLAQKDRTGDPSVLEMAVDHLKSHHPDRPDYNPFVTSVHRLDRPVSGALVLARTSKAASRLSAQFREGKPHKGYLAVVEGELDADSMEVRLWLHKDPARNMVEYSAHPLPGWLEACTRIQVVRRIPDASPYTLVALFPVQGRSHQLRTAMTSLGCPIVGDLRYGARAGLGNWIALHACWLRLEHPVTRQTMRFVAPLPPVWTQHWPALAQAGLG